MIKRKFIFIFSVDPCAAVTCAVTGETCSDGVCKCGTAATCQAAISSSLADSCVPADNVCKCGAVAACAEGQTCAAGVCTGNSNILL